MRSIKPWPMTVRLLTERHDGIEPQFHLHYKRRYVGMTDAELELLKQEIRKALDNLPGLHPKATPPIGIRIPAPPGTRGTPNDPDPTPPMYPSSPLPVKQKCECGSSAAGSPVHSSYCPLYDK